jgi:hypothetical protein
MDKTNVKKMLSSICRIDFETPISENQRLILTCGQQIARVYKRRQAYSLFYKRNGKSKQFIENGLKN